MSNAPKQRTSDLPAKPYSQVSASSEQTAQNSSHLTPLGVALVAAVLSQSKPGTRPQNCFIDARQLLCDAADWLATYNPLTSRDVLQAMGWELYTLDEIWTKKFLGEKYSKGWLRKLIKDCFPERCDKILEAGGLDSSDLSALKNHHHRRKTADTVRKRKKQKPSPPSK